MEPAIKLVGITFTLRLDINSMINSISQAADPSQQLAASAATTGTLQAVSQAVASNDLPGHLLDLANQDKLVDFLGQTTQAVELAKGSEVFAEQLNPLLGDIKSGLEQLPSHRLSRDEREAVADTIDTLSQHLEGVDNGPIDDTPAGQVPGGGLEAHERAGGHTIERHVGKSEEWLINRVNKDKISAASSFESLPEAERVLSEVIALNQDKIDAWVNGQGGNRLVLTESFDSKTGISVARGDNSAEDVFSAKIVLERSDKLDTGYRIVTGYPSAP